MEILKDLYLDCGRIHGFIRQLASVREFHKGIARSLSRIPLSFRAIRKRAPTTPMILLRCLKKFLYKKNQGS